MRLAEAWARLSPQQRMLLTVLDQYLNIRLGRWLPGETIPGETMSARFARSRDRGERAGIKACQILDRVDPGHCDRALL